MDTEQIKLLCSFQHFLGTNFNTLPTDSDTMTGRAVRFLKERSDRIVEVPGPTQRTYNEDYVYEKLEQAFIDSRTAHIFEKGMPPVYRSFLDWKYKNM